MYYVNEAIKNLHRVGGRENRYEYLRLDMNENPGGLPEDFVQRVIQSITPDFLATYPDTSHFIKALADYLNLNEDNLCVTNGSDMAIRYILEVFAQKGSQIVTVAPSFAMYSVYCEMLGLIHKPVEYNNDFTIKAESVLFAIEESTDVVVILNPNNPIGTVFSETELLQIIEKAVKMNAIVLIDEAYYYFYNRTFLNFVERFDNVILIRTFSKLCSLAACRLGYIVANSTLITYIQNARPTFDTNAVALLFGEAILREEGLIDRLISIEAEGRAYVLERLIQYGYEVYAQNGNYIFIKPKTEIVKIAKALEDNKILVKTYSNNILMDYIRITTGSKEIMGQFLELFIKLDKEMG